MSSLRANAALQRRSCRPACGLRRSTPSSIISSAAAGSSGIEYNTEAHMPSTLTFLLMDPPFESARTTSAFRLLDIATRRGHNVNVFAYEGAVALPFAAQKAHANA